jgi:hypothetical protein
MRIFLFLFINHAREKGTVTFLQNQCSTTDDTQTPTGPEQFLYTTYTREKTGQHARQQNVLPAHTAAACCEGDEKKQKLQKLQFAPYTCVLCLSGRGSTAMEEKI